MCFLVCWNPLDGLQMGVQLYVISTSSIIGTMLNTYYVGFRCVDHILKTTLQPYLFNMTCLGNEKTIVLSRYHIFNNMTNCISLSQ